MRGVFANFRKYCRLIVLYVLAMAVVLTVAVLYFAIEIFPLPAGEYKEIANKQDTESQLFNLTVSCLKRNRLAYRIVDHSSIQVQESILDKSISRCYAELSAAHMHDNNDSEWSRGLQFRGGR